MLDDVGSSHIADVTLLLIAPSQWHAHAQDCRDARPRCNGHWAARQTFVAGLLSMNLFDDYMSEEQNSHFAAFTARLLHDASTYIQR